MSTPTEASEAAHAPAQLRARILSGLVLAPAALAGAWAGGPVFVGMVAGGGSNESPWVVYGVQKVEAAEEAEASSSR